MGSTKPRGNNLGAALMGPLQRTAIQNSWLKMGSRVRSPVLPHFLSSIGSEKGSTQLRDDT
jgi:hypothetical protein